MMQQQDEAKKAMMLEEQEELMKEIDEDTFITYKEFLDAVARIPDLKESILPRTQSLSFQKVHTTTSRSFIQKRKV